MKAEGRGAWSSIGGTLRPTSNGTQPGKYYMLASNPNNQIGLKTWCQKEQGLTVTVNHNAVWHGVFAIQMLCNMQAGSTLNGDGIFGPATDAAVKQYQKSAGLYVDGIVGPSTMKAFLTPVVKAAAARHGEDWTTVLGLLRYEGAFDPGAVGAVDSYDLGLSQINIIAHPETSFAQAFCVSYAVDFTARYLKYSLEALDGNERDAVASYNLGIYGTKQWIAAGRPDWWTPPWATSHGPRNVKAYIDRIIDYA